jgi:UDP-glucose 4-epimerase
MHCLVTGGAGFIGATLVAALVARGDRVRVLDNLSTGRRENLAPVAGDVELLEGDIRDEAALKAALRGVEVVFHQAALPSVPQSIADPATSHAVNATGTLNVLVASRDAGARRVVCASSCAVYGDQATQPQREDQPPAPLSPYAGAKLVSEVYAAVWERAYGLETVALRYFNVFGPRQDPASAYAAAIPLFARALLAGRPLTVFGDGEQTRDFVFVGDVVGANLRAAEAPAAPGGVLNVGSGAATSVNTLIATLAALAGRTPEVRYAPPRPGDLRHSRADLTRARTLLDYTPQTPLATGIQATLDWYQSQRMED